MIKFEEEEDENLVKDNTKVKVKSYSLVSKKRDSYNDSNQIKVFCEKTEIDEFLNNISKTEITLIGLYGKSKTVHKLLSEMY